jgi:hypothetical protein
LIFRCLLHSMKIFIEIDILPHGAPISLLTLEHLGGLVRVVMMTYFLRSVLAFILFIVLQ